LSTLQTRTSLILPDDGGPGGDDIVDVTSQISNSVDYLSNGLGIFQCTSSTHPTTQNYIGRLIQETDSPGKPIFSYNGAGWTMVQDTAWRTYTPDVVGSAGATNLGTSPVLQGYWRWITSKEIEFKFFIQYGTGVISGGAPGHYLFKLPDWSNTWGAGNTVDMEQWPYFKLYTNGASTPLTRFGGLGPIRNLAPGGQATSYIETFGLVMTTGPALTTGANFYADGTLMLQ